jgi:hypothetical protein
MARGNSKVVEHLTHYPKIAGSNPAPATVGEKTRN